MPADHELVRWIGNFRERLQRGELKPLTVRDAESDTRDAALVARALLAQLDRLGSLPRDESHTTDQTSPRLWDSCSISLMPM